MQRSEEKKRHLEYWLLCDVKCAKDMKISMIGAF